MRLGSNGETRNILDNRRVRKREPGEQHANVLLRENTTISGRKWGIINIRLGGPGARMKNSPRRHQQQTEERVRSSKPDTDVVSSEKSLLAGYTGAFILPLLGEGF